MNKRYDCRAVNETMERIGRNEWYMELDRKSACTFHGAQDISDEALKVIAQFVDPEELPLEGTPRNGVCYGTIVLPYEAAKQLYKIPGDAWSPGYLETKKEARKKGHLKTRAQKRAEPWMIIRGTEMSPKAIEFLRGKGVEVKVTDKSVTIVPWHELAWKNRCLILCETLHIPYRLYKQLWCPEETYDCLLLKGEKRW